jgi:hypothetical protein
MTTTTHTNGNGAAATTEPKEPAGATARQRRARQPRKPASAPDATPAAGNAAELASSGGDPAITHLEEQAAQIIAELNGDTTVPDGEDPRPIDDDPAERAKLWLMRTRPQRATAIRTRLGYDGTLTVVMISALQQLLDEPTPRKCVVEAESTPDKPFASTGLKTSQYGFDYLNAVYGVAHWQSFVHYTHDGTVAHVYVVVGNNLPLVRLHPETGELIVPDGAEILVLRDGWGGHESGTKGNVLKGSETNAIKRVFARLGVAADVMRLEVEASELLAVADGVRTKTAPRPARPTAPTDAQAATPAQIESLLARATRHHVSPMVLAALYRQAMNLPPAEYATDQVAQAMLDECLPNMTRDIVSELLGLIVRAQAPSAAAPALKPAPTATAAGHAAKPGAAPSTPAAPAAAPAAEAPPTPVVARARRADVTEGAAAAADAAARATRGRIAFLSGQAREKGLTPTRFANLIRRARGATDEIRFASEVEALTLIEAQLSDLPGEMTVTLAQLISAAAGAPAGELAGAQRCASARLKADAAGLGSSDLANLIRRVLGGQETAFAEQADAARVVDWRLPTLTSTQLDQLEQMIGGPANGEPSVTADPAAIQAAARAAGAAWAA